MQQSNLVVDNEAIYKDEVLVSPLHMHHRNSCVVVSILPKSQEISYIVTLSIVANVTRSRSALVTSNYLFNEMSFKAVLQVDRSMYNCYAIIRKHSTTSYIKIIYKL